MAFLHRNNILYVVQHLAFEEHNLNGGTCPTIGPTKSFCKRGSVRIKESGLLFQCSIIKPGGMSYLQYNKPLAEHFPRLERSQGRILFAALSFLWQTFSSPIQTQLCTLSLNSNHNPHLNRNLRRGPKLKISQRRTLFLQSPVSLGAPLQWHFLLSLSLNHRANPSGVLHRAPQLPPLRVPSVSHRKGSGWILVLHGAVGHRQGQCAVKRQEVMGTTFS